MTDILGGLLDLLTGNLQSLTDNLIAIGLALFALALGFFAIGYLNRRRQMLHQERMASLIKGLHYAGVADQVFARPTRTARDQLLSGLRWLVGGAGVAGAFYGYEALQPAADASAAASSALIGLIPGSVGLGQLLCGWICSRRERSTSNRAGLLSGFLGRRVAQPRATAYRPIAYRPAARRI